MLPNRIWQQKGGGRAAAVTVAGWVEAGWAEVGLVEAVCVEAGLAEAGGAEVGLAEAGLAKVGWPQEERVDLTPWGIGDWVQQEGALPRLVLRLGLGWFGHQGMVPTGYHQCQCRCTQPGVQSGG